MKYERKTTTISVKKNIDVAINFLLQFLVDLGDYKVNLDVTSVNELIFNNLDELS